MVSNDVSKSSQHFDSELDACHFSQFIVKSTLWTTRRDTQKIPWIKKFNRRKNLCISKLFCIENSQNLRMFQDCITPQIQATRHTPTTAKNLSTTRFLKKLLQLIVETFRTLIGLQNVDNINIYSLCLCHIHNERPLYFPHTTKDNVFAISPTYLKAT